MGTVIFFGGAVHPGDLGRAQPGLPEQFFREADRTAEALGNLLHAVPLAPLHP